MGLAGVEQGPLSFTVLWSNNSTGALGPCHFPQSWGVMGNLEPSENLEARMDSSSGKVHMAFFHGREYEKRQNPFPYTWSRCFENSHHFNLAVRQSA